MIKGTGKTITTLYAWIADHGDSGEGILGMQTALGMMPMISSSLETIQKMGPNARKIAKQTGTEAKLVKFSGPEQIHLH